MRCNIHRLVGFSCVRCSLLPSTDNRLQDTSLSRTTSDPVFRETFLFAVAKQRLASKTLQLHMWAVRLNEGSDLLVRHCVTSHVKILPRNKCSQ